MKLFASIVLFVALAITAVAQDQQFKIGVNAQASEVKGLVPTTFGSEGTTYRPNIAAEAMATVGRIGAFRASAGATYKHNFDTSVNTYYLNGQASYHYSVLEPFARFSAGIDRAPGGPSVFSREVLLGGDLNFNRFYVRPLAVGFKRTGRFLAPAERTYQSGFGFSF